MTGGGARLLADRLMAPLTDPAAINATAGFGVVLPSPSRGLCEALRPR